MTDIETETITDEADAPVAHVHEGQGEHEHVHGAVPHEHEGQLDPEPADPLVNYVPDPAVQAFCTVITLTVAHTNEEGPYAVVKRVTEQLEGLGLRGVVVGVASVELRGDGGLIGL